MSLSDKDTEAETRDRLINPQLDASGWTSQHRKLERRIIAPGKIVPEPKGGKRSKDSEKIPDYVLEYESENYIAVVEAKSIYKEPGDGLQQAIDYAKMLNANFAYSSNGYGIVEYDFIEDKTTHIDSFPTREELWNRQNKLLKFSDQQKQDYLIPLNKESNDPNGEPMIPRYYQVNAINLAMQKIIQKQKRLLLTLATGTGKTFIAFEIAWKLWKANPSVKILFLADRKSLVRQAMEGAFKPFGDERMHKIQGKANTANVMYFSLYQSLDVEKEEEELYKQYPQDFFDYVIVDECHRGVSSSESEWRNILEYFSSATHIGMTATPSRKNTEDDTYKHFGYPVYEYSLQQGIQDGFLAPFVVTNEILDIDIEGYHPEPDQKDNHGNILIKEKYYRDDFDQIITVKSRQEEVANRIMKFLNEQGKFEKTIVFCQNSKHALAMTELIGNLAKEGPDYCVRITHNEPNHVDYLEDFQNTKEKFPVVAVTSRLMSTGIDAPTCKNIILDKTLRSMVEFKQIIGRGTRISEMNNKYWFNILDFRDCTVMFLDDTWDGPPSEPPLPPTPGESKGGNRPPRHPHLVVDGKEVRVIGRKVSIYDPASGKESFLSLEEFTGNQVKIIEADFAKQLREIWVDVHNRQKFIDKLEYHGITITHIRQLMENESADVFDILYHLAYGSPMKTRRQRIDSTKKKSFLEKYPDKAREVLSVIMELYAERGYEQINPEDPNVLKLKPFEKFGGDYIIKNKIFSGDDEYKTAINDMLLVLYED